MPRLLPFQRPTVFPFAPALIIVSLLLVWSVPLASGQVPSDQELARWIDLEIGKKLEAENLTPAPRSSDEVFARRVYLDLTGRIPSVEHLDEFLADSDPDKRVILIDRLLLSSHHAEHFTNLFDTMLMGRKERKLDERRKHGWHKYLHTVFAENRPWDEVAREILLARADGDQRGHLWFLYERENNHQEIAEAVSKSFFGVDIACAQCHDHLVAEEIKQAHYWGLVGFFKRSKNTQGERGIAIAESAVGGFDDYANPLLGTTESLELTYLLRGTVAEERPDDPAKQEDDDSLYVAVEGEPKVPLFSRREKFVEEILSDHPLLARSMVNRLWGILMGRGLVHPIEKMDSTQSPSHPELLDMLAEDFRKHGYDLRRLIRAIVISEAYQRAAAANSEHLAGDSYAAGLLKPLTAEAYLDSLKVALASTDSEAAIEGWQKLSAQWRKFFPDVIPVSDQATIDQALGLTNGPEFNAVLQQAAEAWVRDTVGQSSEQQVRLAYRRCYARLPDDEEISLISDYLAQRQDRLVEGWAQVFWTLVTAAEFRFNH